jgi:glycosyltransferase involved in cell wall biosynthesis
VIGAVPTTLVVRTAATGIPAGPVGARTRVLHVITALGTGGAERQLESLTKHSGHPARTIALYDAGPIGAAMVAAGREVEVLGMAGWQRFTAPLRLALKIRRFRPDVVHVHLLAGQLWGIPAARLAGVRTVISSEHSLMDDTIENRPLTPGLRRLYLVLERLTSRTVAVSTTTQQRLIRWGARPDHISVVDNGIDFAALRFSATGRERVRRELGICPSSTVVGAVGRLETVKRFEPTIRALAGWLQQGDRHLVIAGDGPLHTELTDLARELGVDDRIHLLGPRTDIPDLLSSFDMLVSPSRDETFGMAVVEALGNGLPVVYAQCPAIDELGQRPAAAFPILPDDRSTASEEMAIRQGVEDALAAVAREFISATGATGRTRASAGQYTAARFEPDPELEGVYGIGTAVQKMDAVYESASRRRS